VNISSETDRHLSAVFLFLVQAAMRVKYPLWRTLHEWWERVQGTNKSYPNTHGC